MKIALLIVGFLLNLIGILYLARLSISQEIKWQLTKKELCIKMVTGIGLIAIGITIFAYAFDLPYIKKTITDIDNTHSLVEIASTEETSTNEIESTEEKEVKTEKELVEQELNKEIDLLRRNDKETLLRWFGDSTDLYGISSSIPHDMIIDEVAEKGYARILIYSEQAKEDIENNIRNQLRTTNIGLSDTELEVLVEQELSEYDESNFYKVHMVKLERQNGLIVVTEHLKNVITNGEYLGRVVKCIDGEAFDEESEETSITDEILNRGVN